MLNRLKALRTLHARYALTRVITRKNASCHAFTAINLATKPQSVALDLKQPNKNTWFKMSLKNHRLLSLKKSRG